MRAVALSLGAHPPGLGARNAGLDAGNQDDYLIDMTKRKSQQAWTDDLHVTFYSNDVPEMHCSGCALPPSHDVGDIYRGQQDIEDHLQEHELAGHDTESALQLWNQLLEEQGE